MGFLIGFLIVVLVLVSLLLILLVLLQDDGAEGAGMLFGSSASQQYGARRGNIVTRTTGILATSFILISIVLVFLFREEETDLQAIERAQGVEEETELLQWWDENANVEAEEGASIVGAEDEPGGTSDAGEISVIDETGEISASSEPSSEPSTENIEEDTESLDTLDNP